MQVLGIVASPRKNGNTDTIVQTILDGAASVGHKTSKVNLNDLKYKGCQGCMYCRTHDHCSQKDDMTGLMDQIKKADVVIFSTPVYMLELSGQFRIMEDRMFPFMDVNFQPRLNSKKAVIVTSQGSPEAKAFDHATDGLANILKTCGFTVVDTIKMTMGNDPKAAKAKKDLMDSAKKLGASF